MESLSANGESLHSTMKVVIKKEEDEYEEQFCDFQVPSPVETKQEEEEGFGQRDPYGHSHTGVVKSQPLEAPTNNADDESEGKNLKKRKRKRGGEERERAVLSATVTQAQGSLWHCGLCQRSFSSPWELNGHCCAGPMGRGGGVSTKLEFSCPVCGDRFLRPTAFIMHKQSHVGQSQYVCGVCGCTVKTLDKLLSHRQSHMCGLTPRPRCLVCSCSFHSLEGLKSHMQDQHGKDAHGKQEGKEAEEGEGHSGTLTRNSSSLFAESLQCLRCFVTFRDAETAERHMRFKHPADYKQTIQGHTIFACCVCDRTFPSSRLLSEHQRTHSKWSLTSSGLDESMQETREENGAEVKMKVESEGEVMADKSEMSKSRSSSMRCLHCHIIFMDARVCERHMISKHSDSSPLFTPGPTGSRYLSVRPQPGQQRPYSCSTCGEKFIQKSSLTKHFTEAHMS